MPNQRLFTVQGYYTIAQQVEVIATDAKDAIQKAKKKIGRTESEYHKVEFEVEESFLQ